MKSADFDRVVANTPTFVPIFRLKRLPKWMEAYGAQVGDEFFLTPAGSFIHLGTNPDALTSYHLSPSCIEFVEYRNTQELYA
jgi:hypothetical protein